MSTHAVNMSLSPLTFLAENLRPSLRKQWSLLSMVRLLYASKTQEMLNIFAVRDKTSILAGESATAAAVNGQLRVMRHKERLRRCCWDTENDDVVH